MIKPTIGRVVWYWPKQNARDIQPMAAMVTWVHSDTLVNLVVFDSEGHSYSRVEIPLSQDETTKPVEEFCEWMPYQKGQAAKTEEIEKKLGGQ